MPSTRSLYVVYHGVVSVAPQLVSVYAQVTCRSTHHFSDIQFKTLRKPTNDVALLKVEVLQVKVLVWQSEQQVW
jgi:hypothetical protein